MEANAKNKVEHIFKTEESSRILDYLANNREPSSSDQIKSYLNISTTEKTIEALNSLEELGLAKHEMVGPLQLLRVYAITAEGVEKNNEAKMKTF